MTFLVTITGDISFTITAPDMDVAQTVAHETRRKIEALGQCDIDIFELDIEENPYA